MNKPHRIHLKGPWECEWLHGPFPGLSDGPAGTPAKQSLLKMPIDWLGAFGSCAGAVRFSRRFQKPTNLSPLDRVLLAFDGVGGAAVFRLNGVEIGRSPESEEQASFDITDRLELTNQLTVEVTFDPAAASQGGLWGPVAIEIYSAS